MLVRLCCFFCNTRRSVFAGRMDEARGATIVGFFKKRRGGKYLDLVDRRYFITFHFNFFNMFDVAGIAMS